MGPPYVFTQPFASQRSSSVSSNSAEKDVHSITNREAKDAKQLPLERI